MHENNIAPIGVATQQITTLIMPVQYIEFVAIPMPAIEPTIACEVLIGSDITVIIVTVIAAETDTIISIEGV